MKKKVNNMHAVLLGTAIGDSLGVPFEKREPNDPFLLAWDGKTFLGSEYHGLKSAQYSDDTQFSLAVAQSLVDNNGFNPDDLSKRYIELFISNTIRGYGRTTKLAIDRLIAGTHWSESGVVDSYGNGTAMRASPFGVYYRHDLRTLVDVVKIDSAITHASHEAEAGALAVAVGTYLICNDYADADLIPTIVNYLPDSSVREKLISLKSLLSNDIMHQEALQFLGSKADVRDTVPAVFYCYLKFNSFQCGVEAAIRAAFDADTTGAITGALYGAKLGIPGIPEFYIENIENRDNLILLDQQLFDRKLLKLFPR